VYMYRRTPRGSFNKYRQDIIIAEISVVNDSLINTQQHILVLKYIYAYNKIQHKQHAHIQPPFIACKTYSNAPTYIYNCTIVSYYSYSLVLIIVIVIIGPGPFGSGFGSSSSGKITCPTLFPNFLSHFPSIFDPRHTSRCSFRNQLAHREETCH
jgi:hypothetical protein